MGLWYEETFKGTRLSLEVTDTFFSGKSEYQKVEIFETREYGRALAIDSVFMTSEGDEFVYHEMLTHPALLTAKDPKRVLVIGGGDGGTVREVLTVGSAVLAVCDGGQSAQRCRKLFHEHGGGHCRQRAPRLRTPGCGSSA